MKTISQLAIAATLVVSAACSSAAPASAATITATLNDNSIALSQASTAPGLVTFKVVNSGSVIHSLQLLKTDLPHDKIPADPQDASKPQRLGLLRETGAIAARGSKEFIVKLGSGSYVLVCDQPAHYIAGMHIGFTVK